MHITHRSHTARLAGALALALVAALTVAGTPAGAGGARYVGSDVTFTGHGFGYGIGMGQWGAFGYAAQYHETYTWILSHFYGGTTPATLGSNPTISVAISENDGADIVLTSGAAYKVAGKSLAAGTSARLLLTGASSGTWELDSRSGGCASSAKWSKVASTTDPLAVPSTEAAGATASQVLELCRADGVDEPLRGQVEGVVHDGTPRTVNLVALEEYLRGVVPSEMPADWGEEGSAGPGGRAWGFQALEAQAVAARSYAVAYYTVDGGWFGYADICDFTDCQAYEGMLNENPLSDAAVSATAGKYLVLTGTKTAATTQYSASTGGYTAGGPFPAVPDAGDAVCLQPDSITCNPNHDWTASVPVTTVEAAYPSVGTLSSVSVTERDGLGALGGRVLGVTISGSGGSVTTSGIDFAGAVGLLSNWFAVTNGPGGSGGGLGGYWVATSSGEVRGFGGAPQEGSLGSAPAAPVVAVVQAPAGVSAVPAGVSVPAALSGAQPAAAGAGYWLAGAAGAVYPFGSATADGSMAGHHLNEPIVGMAPTPDGAGYWLVASDGGIFSFGDARFHGSMGGRHLNEPIVGMAATPDGAGYWLVAADGGIFSFGDARFHGSMGGRHLNSPIVGMAATPDGAGYWLVAADGGVFSFGDARFAGSLGGSVLVAPATAILPTPDAGGYEILTADGGVHPFGDAPQFGDLSGSLPAGAVAVGIAGVAS